MDDYKKMDQILKDCASPSSGKLVAEGAVTGALVGGLTGFVTTFANPIGAAVGAGIGAGVGAGIMADGGNSEKDSDACVGHGVKKLLRPPGP